MRRRRVLQLGAAALACAACAPEPTDRRDLVAVVVGLPADPVGFAAYLYRPHDDVRVLRTADGSEHFLEPPRDDGIFTITLSPSGRWLGWSKRSSFHLRDLTGSTGRRFTGESEVTGAWWSPNGRWLLLSENRDDTWTLVDLDAGAVTRPHGLHGTVVGLSPDGRVLLSNRDPSTAVTTFRWFEPRSGQSGPTVTATAQDALSYPANWPVPGPEATTAVVPFFTAQSALDPYSVPQPLTSLVEFDLTDGHEVARRSLDPDERWDLRAGWVNGVTVTRRREGVLELVRLPDLTADPLVLAQLRPDAEVTPPGTTTH